jgi:hypothetical protein
METKNVRHIISGDISHVFRSCTRTRRGRKLVHKEDCSCSLRSGPVHLLFEIGRLHTAQSSTHIEVLTKVSWTTVSLKTWYERIICATPSHKSNADAAATLIPGGSKMLREPSSVTSSKKRRDVRNLGEETIEVGRKRDKSRH